MFTYWDLDLTSTAIVSDARLVMCTVISHAIYARAGIKIIWTWRDCSEILQRYETEHGGS